MHVSLLILINYYMLMISITALCSLQ